MRTIGHTVLETAPLFALAIATIGAGLTACMRTGSNRLLVSLFLTAALLLAGCSNSKQLSSPGDAASFVADLARGGNAASWQLASGASTEATRAWAERGALADFRRRLRATKAPWACELAEGSIQIGFGTFTQGDRLTVTSIAENKGANHAQVDAMVADVSKIANPDLKTLTTAICG